MNTPLPQLISRELRFNTQSLADPDRTVTEALAALNLKDRVRPGQSVAVAVGSRGIQCLVPVVAALCTSLTGLDLEPFIVPAMGSHGGATAQGQEAVLAALGVTEESVGAPIRSNMGTVLLGETDAGDPVYTDDLAAQADHVVVVNRIKAHTKFKGRVESGLLKMLCVGLGKHEGAKTLHARAVTRGFYPVVRDAGRLALEKLPVLFGLGIVENGAGQVHTIEVLPPEVMEDREAELLTLAKDLMPKLPYEDIDLLIVEEIGKDISGTGMDTNVIGRNRDILGDWDITPRVKRIVVLGLSKGSRGNGLGIGFADFTTDAFVRNMDYEKTIINAMTGISPEKAAIPIHLPTEEQAVRAALDSLGPWHPDTVKVVRIRNTKDLERIQISPALAKG